MGTIATYQKNAELMPVQTGQPEGLICPFNNIGSFENAWRMAGCLSASSIVPNAFRGPEGRANAMIALELASRLQTSVFMVMQHLYIIQGRPAFSSQFIIAAIQACGRFSALKYKKRYDQNGKITGCRAYATELSSGDTIEGPEVTMEMAKEEGWLTKNGSKWRTMPEVMMTYRAASFFGRLYAPDVMMGFRSDDEVVESEQAAATITPMPARVDKTAELNALLEEPPTPAKQEAPAAEKAQTPPEEKPQPKNARSRLGKPVEPEQPTAMPSAPEAKAEAETPKTARDIVKDSGAPVEKEKTMMETLAELKAKAGLKEGTLIPNSWDGEHA